MKKIEVGQIWLVVNDFWTSEDNKFVKGREVKIKIKKGEKIEVRYPYEWHLRTEDSIYFHIKPDVLLENCLYFGYVDKKTKTENKLNLNQILEQKKYVFANEDTNEKDNLNKTNNV